MQTSLQGIVRRWARRWSAPAIVALAASGPAVADPASTSTSSETLGEIVVTAQYRAQKLEDTPIAITAENAAVMEDRNQTSLHDLTAEAPNVTLVQTGGAFGPGMTASIRGIGQGDFDPALSPGVGIYIDDVYYTSLEGSNFALLDIDRVEILRGPQGTLSGANSEGGSIKIYSVKPQGNDSGSVKVSYGERSLVDVQGMADVSIIKDTLFMRLSGVSRTQDGYVTRVDYGCAFPTSGIPPETANGVNCIAGKEGGQDYAAGRIALRWVPTDSFEANWTTDVTNDKSETVPVTLIQVNPAALGNALANTPSIPAGFDVEKFIPTNPYVSYANFCAKGIATSYCWAPLSEDKAWGTNLTADWRITDDLALKSITAYREFTVQFTNDDAASPIGGSLGYSELLNHTLTQELRLNGKVDSIFDYTVGGFLLDQVTTYPTHQVLDYVFNPNTIPGKFFNGSFEFLGDDPVWERDYAGFMNGSWHIIEGLDLNAGVRYTHQEKTYTYTRANPPDLGGGNSIFFPPDFSGTQGKYEGSKVDYRVDLDYRWNPSLMTYASVSTGFKGGGTNPRPFIASQVVPFGPESLTAYELGAKSELLDKSLIINLAAFYDKYHDIQVTLLSCPQFSGGNPFEPCAAPVNGGDADIYGAELETSYHIAGLTVDGTYSHQKFEYKSVNPLSGIPLGSSAPGFQPSKYALGAEYNIAAGEASVVPRVDFLYASGYFTNANNDPNSWQAGYHTVNGRITYHPPSGGWEFAVAGTNLGNKLWYTSTFDLTATEGTKYGTPAPPRTVWAEFKKKW